ncbi:hypothetical protein ACIRP7_09770 [Streptomyces sp. NPDC102270]|uniref:hypothetical protein n=1 Tax=Streptomyces sp. NPDC102270 TaxID=3366150 RepID=UPI0038304C04
MTTVQGRGARVVPAHSYAGAGSTIGPAMTPTASVGTVVHGTVYVDSDSAFSGVMGSELTGIPYSCTVG